MFALHPIHSHHTFHVPGHTLRYVLAGVLAVILFFLLAAPARMGMSDCNQLNLAWLRALNMLNRVVASTLLGSSRLRWTMVRARRACYRSLK